MSYPQLKPEEEFVCYCSICNEAIFENQLRTPEIVDKKIYDTDGCLSEIQLAHSECAPEWENSL